MFHKRSGCNLSTRSRPVADSNRSSHQLQSSHKHVKMRWRQDAYRHIWFCWVYRLPFLPRHSIWLNFFRIILLNNRHTYNVFFGILGIMRNCVWTRFKKWQCLEKQFLNDLKLKGSEIIIRFQSPPKWILRRLTYLFLNRQYPSKTTAVQERRYVEGSGTLINDGELKPVANELTWATLNTVYMVPVVALATLTSPFVAL